MNKLLEINTINKTQAQKITSSLQNMNKISPNKLKKAQLLKSKTFIKDPQKFEPKQKQYCCLYHYTQGKKTKGISPCNDHVSLGVINPITTLTRQQIQKIKDAHLLKYNKLNKYQQQNLVVDADPYEFNFHTHFINQIEKRGSKPKQLIKPRVYVQKILPKNYVRKNQNLLYPRSETKAQFKQIFNYFKLLAQKTQFKTQQQLRDDVIAFAKRNNIKTLNIGSRKDILSTKIDKTTAAQYLFSKEDFIGYLMTNRFPQDIAQKFWQIAYNKDRFIIPQKSQANLSVIKNEFVSMRAFIYNYRKFYLQQEQYYRNVFSQPALRQRLIDLRLSLEPWFNKNIILKSKLQKWKKIQLQTLQYIKNNGFDKEYQTMLKLIQDRNRINYLMRTISKSIYDLTDQKNLGMDVWNNRITYLIEQKSDSLICFMEFIQKFKQHLMQQQLQNLQSDQSKPFRITQLIQFLNLNKNLYNQLQQKWIIKWIKNIYKYLFFYKEHQQLYLDPISFKLSTKSSINIQKQLISQFIHFKSSQTDNNLQILRNLTQQIQQKLSQMPQLQGKKKYLVQCNYLVETLLRIIKRQNFTSFHILYQITQIVQDHWFDFQNCCQDILDVLRSSSQKNISFNLQQKFWKDLFNPVTQPKSNIDLSQATQNKQSYTYKDALDKYNNVKNALGIVNSAANLKPSKSNANQLKITKVKPSQKQIKNLPKKAGQFLQKINKDKQQVKQKIDQFDWGLKYKRHEKQCCSQGYCLHCDDVISTQVSSTIGRVEDMQNYLMDLLRDV